MKVLVTGGAGYVGSTLALELLSQGHEVTVFDCLLHGGEGLLPLWAAPRFRFIKGDVRDCEAVEKALTGQDAVVHLAAIVGDQACAAQPELARVVNTDASLALLGLCSASKVGRLVFASTCSNYGQMTDPDGYVDETSELRPISLYAQTKVAVERAILEDKRESYSAATVLRLATVFGVSPRMRFDLTINQFVFEMLLNRELVVFGETFWRPYIHVRDVARAISMTLEADADTVAGKVFNVGDTNLNFQKKQLVELIRPYIPEANVRFVHKEEDPRDYRVSFERIKRELGFSCSRSVGTGIKELVDLASSGIILDFQASRYRN